MMRWTTLAIAVLIAGCAKGERNQDAQSSANSTTDTAIRTESTPGDTASVALTADSGAAKKSASTTAGKTRPDSSARNRTSASSAAPSAGGVTGAEAMMGVSPTGGVRQLSKDQLKQLQAALKKEHCYSGTPDGVGGPATQSAIACGLEKYKLTPNDMSGLYKKLGLKF